MNFGIIAAGHEETARAGAEILRAGGNAFDAAIAALLMAGVAETSSISLAGGGFLLAQTCTGESRLFDFFTQSPRSKKIAEGLEVDFYPIEVNFGETSQEFHIGWGSVAVPGVIAGAFEVHKKLGYMPFSELAKPAIEAAKRGVKLNRFQHIVASLLKPILNESVEGQKAYFNAEYQELKSVGENVHFDHLADTIEFLSKEGPREFYEGEIAESIANYCAFEGGYINKEDLVNYSVVERKPIVIPYRNKQIICNPPPSAGGILIAFSLAFLNKFPLGRERWNSTKHLELLGNSMQASNDARVESGLGDVLHQPLVFERFVNEANVSQFSDVFSSKLGSTTHISVIDAKGNTASLTTSAGEGAGRFIKGTGIQLNNMLGEADLNPKGFHNWKENVRLSSMMTPAILLNDGNAEMVFGSSGSNRIRTAMLQTVCNVLDFEMDIEPAVQAPRIHWENGKADYELGFDPDEIAKINHPKNWDYKQWQKKSMFFGGVNAIAKQKSGLWAGAGDHRRDGVVIEC